MYQRRRCIQYDVETEPQEVTTVETNTNNEKEETVTTVVDEPVVEETPTQPNNELFSGYKLIEVDGGDLSGYREPNVVVDIGYGDREYWAFTNEYGQLVRVIADEIILQDDITNLYYRLADTILMRQRFLVSKVTF